MSADLFWSEFDRAEHRASWPTSFPDSPWAEAVWPSTNYPSRPKPRPVTGWTCAACGSGFAPQVTRCTECGPQAKTETDCKPPREGGMCSCDEGGD